VGEVSARAAIAAGLGSCARNCGWSGPRGINPNRRAPAAISLGDRHRGAVPPGGAEPARPAEGQGGLEQRNAAGARGAWLMCFPIFFQNAREQTPGVGIVIATGRHPPPPRVAGPAEAQPPQKRRLRLIFMFAHEIRAAKIGLQAPKASLAAHGRVRPFSGVMPERRLTRSVLASVNLSRSASAHPPEWQRIGRHCSRAASASILSRWRAFFAGPRYVRRTAPGSQARRRWTAGTAWKRETPAPAFRRSGSVPGTP
jgi:hypothetical protein